MHFNLLRPSAAALLLAFATAPVSAAPGDKAVTAIARSAAFTKAQDALAADFDRHVEEVIAITEIPAPPFKETARGKAMADYFRAAGLQNVTVDAEGNVTAERPGTDRNAKFVAVAAHLDTVFPDNTPIKVRREGDRLFAPGIGDDSRGLANLLAYARALDAAGFRTQAPILFVANVGEEGPGNLRGVRHLFTKGDYKDRIGAFFSIDGSGADRIVNGGVGSKRYHLVFKGPGGHSYGAFGLVNPMNAMASSINALYRIVPPANPKTTYSASVTGGGTSVNSIPHEVFVDIDMRSESAAELARLDQQFVAAVNQAVADENAARSTRSGSVSVAFDLIGERPAGSTPADTLIVRATSAAITAKGFKPELTASSTDANLPMSLGIPAVTIGAGGSGGRAHATDEYIDIPRDETLRGMAAGLLAILGVAGVR